jgi:hypothetical protein
MKRKSIVFILACVFSLLYLSIDPSSGVAAKVEKKAKTEKAIPGTVAERVPNPNAAFDVSKMTDMSQLLF